MSNFADLIETIVGKGYKEELAGYLRKVDPNESGNLDRFSFVGRYVEKDVSLDSAEEVERSVDCGYRVSLMDLQ